MPPVIASLRLVEERHRHPPAVNRSVGASGARSAPCTTSRASPAGRLPAGPEPRPRWTTHHRRTAPPRWHQPAPLDRLPPPLRGQPPRHPGRRPRTPRIPRRTAGAMTPLEGGALGLHQRTPGKPSGPSAERALGRPTYWGSRGAVLPTADRGPRLAAVGPDERADRAHCNDDPLHYQQDWPDAVAVLAALTTPLQPRPARSGMTWDRSSPQHPDPSR